MTAILGDIEQINEAAYKVGQDRFREGKTIRALIEELMPVEDEDKLGSAVIGFADGFLAALRSIVK